MAQASGIPETRRQWSAPSPGPFPALDAALQGWLDDRLRGACDYAALRDELERRVLALLLPPFDHKPTHLARALRLNRATLRKRLRDHGAGGRT